MFKEMEVNFKVVKDEPFEKGEFNLNRVDWTFKVKRYKSGCFEYGDKSGHSITINNPANDYFVPNYYDTRYDGISTEKEKWIEFWKGFIEDKWVVKLEVLDFSESEVNE